MRKWFVGDNDPGCPCDTDPVKFDTWAQAHRHLRATVGERFVAMVDDEGIDRRMPEVMGNYVVASALIRRADPDHPLSLFWNGRVWWLADLPE